MTDGPLCARVVTCLAALVAALLLPEVHAATPQLRVEQAELTPAAVQAATMAITRAGNRLVAVGAQGVILLSDDGGAHFRQARRVPVNATLTAVSFADAHHGWAVGNWGVILDTQDGGETWNLQRLDIHKDIPLFGVHFQTARIGWAVGLWSLLLATDDAGATWRVVPPPAERGADRTGLNFYAVIPGGPDTLLIPAEQGKVVRSTDDGASWAVVDTGYAGSLWCGLALRDGTLLLGGLRGSIFRSIDRGLTWQRARNTGQSSVTGLAQLPDGDVAASALDGVVLHSENAGASFTAVQRSDRAELTGVIAGAGGGLILTSRNGTMASR